jgi:hypothetical protein
VRTSRPITGRACALSICSRLPSARSPPSPLTRRARIRRASRQGSRPEERIWLTPGQTFGAYRIEHLLGCGGMGDVYKAEQIEQGRRVALKVLNRRLFGNEDRARFLRKGQLAASLIALMFSTARRRNGFAGIHDLWSVTCVVRRLDERKQPSPRSELELSIRAKASHRSIRCHRHAGRHRDRNASRRLRPTPAAPCVATPASTWNTGGHALSFAISADPRASAGWADGEHRPTTGMRMKRSTANR